MPRGGKRREIRSAISTISAPGASSRSAARSCSSAAGGHRFEPCQPEHLAARDGDLRPQGAARCGSVHAPQQPAFLDALADEAADGLQLLCDLERSWFAARCAAAAGRRSTSRAAACIDILAAAPLASATTLAAGLGMAVKNAIALLIWFAEAGIAVEVTRRSKRRLFGLAGLAPLRDEVAPPRRPEPGRGRGRPPLIKPKKRRQSCRFPSAR